MKSSLSKRLPFSYVTSTSNYEIVEGAKVNVLITDTATLLVHEPEHSYGIESLRLRYANTDVFQSRWRISVHLDFFYFYMYS